ncbi:winged helix DNA-binding domain-containing protein [Streptomyces sp. NRRL F-5123]|uniref:winged helix DNA-binding domain-containing protein n=1 Tax=Streptomyces sp. NRRL F-5123 TaxID=1463856 RepID=UPI0004E22404|nr:winged helix DNA-binding domain-containing protein [Streptomyces sp. NRRL F-5123]
MPLSQRTLNRTLLTRQHLLHRAGPATTAEDVVAHLLGMQSQVPTSPYPGLWTRLGTFDVAELGRLLTERRVVRLAMMRSTVHLVTAQDALRLRPWVEPMLRRSFAGSQWAKGLAGADEAALTAEGRALLREKPRTPAELRAALAPRFPAADPAALVNALRSWLPLVQLPPRGVWGAGGETTYGLLDEWLGAEPAEAADCAETVRRYLAAFGPAAPADLQKWSGLTGLKSAFAGLDLRTYTTEDGRELYDLPEAELADPDVPVTARFVADFDNVLLSHADRTRIVPEAYRTRVMTVNGIVRGTILVDGFVAGTWRFVRAKGTAAVEVTHFAPLSPADRGSLTSEALRLLATTDPDARPEVTFTAG